MLRSFVPMTRSASLAGTAPAWALAVAIGCGGEPGSAPQPTTTSRPSTTAVTPTTVAIPPSTTLAPAPLTADEARRLLEERGLDPDALSQEVGKQMRERFKPKASE